ncbi:MAG: hypothetical protein IT324_14515 [Anaerolineae bacterium]|nr:hypothetical protein [Anaerolineae bacterium]
MMYLTITDFIEPTAVTAANRLTLTNNNVLRLPRHAGKLRVVAGVAWVSAAGRDHIIGAGEGLSLTVNRDAAIVTAVGKNPLVIEVTGR